MNTVIIGGGISGCIYAFYHPECIFICDDKNKKDNPFVFIHSTKYSKKLLHDIGIESDTLKIQVLTKASNSEDIAETKGVNRNYLYKGTGFVCNTGKSRLMEIYPVSESEICNKIYSIITNRLIESRAINITGNLIILENGDKIEYSKIISTINFNDFSKINQSWNQGSDISNSCFIYSVDDYKIGAPSSVEYFDGEGKNGYATRIVKNGVIGKIGIEYREGFDSEIVKKENYIRFTGSLNPPPENIVFLGRSATGNAHWMIEDSIYTAQRGIVFSEMIDEQRRFDIAVKEKISVPINMRIQNLILGAHSELSELKEVINWDMHKRNVNKINSRNVLEECTDVVKYIYAIMHEFNFTPREIEEAFWEKSEIVWRRFLNEFYGGV